MRHLRPGVIPMNDKPPQIDRQQRQVKQKDRLDVIDIAVSDEQDVAQNRDQAEKPHGSHQECRQHRKRCGVTEPIRHRHAAEAYGPTSIDLICASSLLNDTGGTVQPRTTKISIAAAAIHNTGEGSTNFWVAWAK